MNSIKELPFFFKSNSSKDNNGYPEILPFSLYYDDDLKMFRQKTSAELVDTLKRVYNEGSLADGSVSSESGHVYVDKIINYLFEHFSFKENSQVLEVGFGSGLILRELKQKGVKHLTGIEPGNHIHVPGLEGIKLVDDFFPSAKIKQKFDLIYTLLVLEHIEDGSQYLASLIEGLNENGKIIFAVPNCESYLEEGDLSIFIHEHYSYFTGESIKNVIAKTSFLIEDITTIEGAFIVTISNIGSKSSFDLKAINAETFNVKVHKNLAELTALFSGYKDHELTVYAPIRALNALFLTGRTGFRLVDDNSEMQGKFLPTLTSRIESFEEIAENQPKCILIFSRTFGERIKKKCLTDIRLQHTRILTLNDLDKT
jgi:2-polyprenyl-3-methyl-5-hydroxy-6-metoxy-1,4-benzoquinol methylase